MQSLELYSSGLTVIVVCAIIFLCRKIPIVIVRKLSPFLGLGILSYHLFYTYLITTKVGFDLTKFLPLHMCDLALFLVALNFLTPRQYLFEAGYFWGVFGALCSFLAPVINFPDLYAHYFIFHGLLVFTIFWNLFIAKHTPRKFSFIKVLLWSLLVIPTVGSFNYIVGSNYMFLNSPPDFSFVALAPFHLVSYFFTALVMFFLLTIPFIKNKKKQYFC